MNPREAAASAPQHRVEQRPYEPPHRRETSENPSRRVPGRPRSEHANRAIMSATLEMLDEGVPVDVLSVEAVASRAGVGKATVYRRWPNKYAMVAAALASLGDLPARVSGVSVREDLTGVLGNLLSWSADSRSARALPYLMSSMTSEPIIRDEYYRVVLEPRIAVLRKVLRGGVQRRELRAELDIDLAVSVLVSPAVSSLVMPRKEEEAREESAILAGRLVDLFLAGTATEEVVAVGAPTS